MRPAPSTSPAGQLRISCGTWYLLSESSQDVVVNQGKAVHNRGKRFSRPFGLSSGDLRGATRWSAVPARAILNTKEPRECGALLYRRLSYGAIVMTTVAGGEFSPPSLAVYVKVSSPVTPTGGV